MIRKAVSGIMLTLLLISMLTLAFNIQPVRASGTIYIRADGSVEGTIHISSFDNVTYTFTDNIYDEIVIERDNIVVDGAGYTVQCIAGGGYGIFLDYRNNVTLKGVEVTNFDRGIYIHYSNNNTLTGNTASNNGFAGICLVGSNNNTLTGNTASNNTGYGIFLNWCSNNTLTGNTASNNGSGIMLVSSSNNNALSGNTAASNNDHGICLGSFSNNNALSGNTASNNGNDGIHVGTSSYNTLTGNTASNNTNYGIILAFSSDNVLFHSNLIDNTVQASVTAGYVNIWDDGYPSGGNYWSDYEERYPDAEELDGSGIWNTPYVIDENNQDNYPLMNPWTPTPPVITATIDIDPDTLNLMSEAQWITAYMQLPEGYNPENADVTTILLNETIQPVLDPQYDFVTNSSEYIVDHDEDGILERMVKFDRAEVMALLSVGDAALSITGEVNSTPFEGTDTIRVIDE